MSTLGRFYEVPRFPARTELTVLGADDPGARRIGFRIKENLGIGAYNPNGLKRLQIDRGECAMRNEMVVKVKVADLISKLEANREQHAAIVAEARAGYLAKAKRVLEERLETIAREKIVSLSFTLSTPQDHTAEYDTALGMLRMAVESNIDLNAGDYRQLVEDEWGWTDQFLYGNACYSSTSRRFAEAKGLGVRDGD